MYTEPIQKHIVLPLEKLCNNLFSQKYNPFYYHGALPNFFLWTLFLTGLLLFVYYRPLLADAYQSIGYITYEVPFGNAMRSLHRYAADGMMIFVMLHLCRVWFTDRYREYRILPWITGVILLVILFFIGLSGYLMIWDEGAVNLAHITAEFTRQLPVIGPATAQFLMAGDKITDYTLTRFMFLHLGLPLLMMFMLWMHYMRITRPVSVPPFALNMILLGGLLLVAAAFPVELGKLHPHIHIPTQALEIDRFYAWPQELFAVHGWDASWVWVLLLLVPVGLLILPYLQKKGLRDQYAKVVDEKCTGCSMCYHDCPYEAIVMIDRNDESRFKRLAIVDAGRCANCGLCVGACAFKAIDIPRRDSEDVLSEIELALSGK